MSMLLLNSVALSKMWVSFAGIILLIVSIGLILLSRHVLKGFLKGIFSILAYLTLILGSLIIIYIVLSGPTYS